MNKKRVLLYLITAVFSATLSIVFTFLYGQLFSHDRYWNRTIKRVVITESKIIEGFLKLNGMSSVIEGNRDNFDSIFYPLYGKISVTLYDGKSIIYNNTNKLYILSQDNKRISIPNSNFIVEINSYVPPKWSDIFLKWLTRPGQWFTSGFDYITYQFLTMFIIMLFCSYAILWRFRAAYLSKDVLTALDSIAGNSRFL